MGSTLLQRHKTHKNLHSFSTTTAGQSAQFAAGHQRLPPEMRIFFPASGIFSKISTCKRQGSVFGGNLCHHVIHGVCANIESSGQSTSAPAFAAKYAAVRPAAPPPTTITGPLLPSARQTQERAAERDSVYLLVVGAFRHNNVARVAQ